VCTFSSQKATLTGQSGFELCLQKNVLTVEELNLILDINEITNHGVPGAALLNKNKTCPN